MSEYIQIYKGYQIKPSREHPKTYIVVTDGKGGKIPDVLTGMFTSRRIAQDVIDNYLASKPKKESVNGNEARATS